VGKERQRKQDLKDPEQNIHRLLRP
jgi:hypothetical protein